MATTQAPAGPKTKWHFLENLDLKSLLKPSPSHLPFTATKVTITIGPPCQSVEMLCQLLEAGVTCARCDLTWGTLEFHRKSLENLHEAMLRTRKLCAVMLDTTGREIVIDRDTVPDENGWLEHTTDLTIEAQDKVVLSTKPNVEVPGALVLRLSYAKYPSMMEVGDQLLLGRYLATGSEQSSVWLSVDEVTPDQVSCTARNHAVLAGLLTVFHTERSTYSLANVQNDLPILSAADKEMITKLGRAYDIDFVSLSYTRTAEDITEVRSFLDNVNMPFSKVLAKLESRQALYNFPAIAGVADGIIISRGNLGLDVPPEKIALVQKGIAIVCNILGKPCMITRVLDSMVAAPRPTRAEATDVANAVLDGVDAILAGAETVRGKYPLETVQTALRISREAEEVFDRKHHFEVVMQAAGEVSAENERRYEEEQAADGDQNGHVAPEPVHHEAEVYEYEGNPSGVHTPAVLARMESMASSAVRAAEKVGAAMIICYTHTGTIASLVSKYRPRQPIMVLVVPRLVSDNLAWKLEGSQTAKQLQIISGVRPTLAAPSPSWEMLMEEVVQMNVAAGMIKPGDNLVVIQRLRETLVLKIVTVNSRGTGLAIVRSKSLEELMKATAGIPLDEELPVDSEGQGGLASSLSLKPSDVKDLSISHNGIEVVDPMTQPAIVPPPSPRNPRHPGFISRVMGGQASFKFPANHYVEE
ncbi:hypothetical protein WJX72_011225 [[Myrmecia] bisecta]|uniref:Pyruvate kinase n=1 Tax=[Myrmecia] bisecta TaxID=41462 RepID=A0AAW1PB70_9CHLO